WHEGSCHVNFVALQRRGPEFLLVSGGVLMRLDANTLYLVTIYVEAILGLLLLFAGIQNSDIRAIRWWGFAHLLLAMSLVMFGTQGSLHDAISVDLAHVTMVLAFGVTWNGARVFDGRKPL